MNIITGRFLCNAESTNTIIQIDTQHFSRHSESTKYTPITFLKVFNDICWHVLSEFGSGRFVRSADIQKLRGTEYYFLATRYIAMECTVSSYSTECFYSRIQHCLHFYYLRSTKSDRFLLCMINVKSLYFNIHTS